MSIPRNPVIVVPARLAATRFPDKPLADIDGVPMIVHVWRRAVEADIGPVLVAAGGLGEGELETLVDVFSTSWIPALVAAALGLVSLSRKR